MDPITGTGTRAAQVTCPLPVSPPRREKDALWQKTEGIDAPAPSPAPREAGLCARCHKDFRLLSRRYSCRWAPGDTRGHRGTPGDVGTWGRRARVAQPSPHPLLLAGCARARCATRAPWTWASRGGAACSATSRGTRRLREPRGGAVPLRLGARGLRAAPGTPGFGAEMFSARPARGEGNKPGPASPAPPVWSVRRQHGWGGQGDGGTGVSEPSPRGLSFSGVSQALPRPGVEGS